MLNLAGPTVNCGSYEVAEGESCRECANNECWVIGCPLFAKCGACLPHTRACNSGSCNCGATHSPDGTCECLPGRSGERCTLPCPCDKCDGSGNCVTGGIPTTLIVCDCPSGTTKIGGNCMPCVHNCDTCSDKLTDYCTDCKPGYVLLPSGQFCDK
jgi:hypothetical protein